MTTMTNECVRCNSGEYVKTPEFAPTFGGVEYDKSAWPTTHAVLAELGYIPDHKNVIYTINGKGPFDSTFFTDVVQCNNCAYPKPKEV